MKTLMPPAKPTTLATLAAFQGPRWSLARGGRASRPTPSEDQTRTTYEPSAQAPKPAAQTYEPSAQAESPPACRGSKTLCSRPGLVQRTLRRTTMAIVGFASAIALPQPALAQLDSLTRVEQGYSDIEPIARSLRVQPHELRQSVGFDILYKGTWADPGAAPRDVFARRHGAITAVFPRSSYVQTEQGVVPEIPAGTIFYFGDVPPTLRETTQRQRAAIDRLGSTPGRRNLRRETAVPSDPNAPLDGQAVPSPDVPMSIWASERYRQIRVGRLLQAAAAAERDADLAPDDTDP